MARITGSEITNAVISHIRSYADINEDFTVCAYERPQKIEKKGYIVVINSVFQSDSEMNESFVNVNVHMKDNMKGDINASLTSYADNIVSVFDEDLFAEGSWIEYVSSSAPMKDSDGTHFINIRLKCHHAKINN